MKTLVEYINKGASITNSKKQLITNGRISILLLQKFLTLVRWSI